MDDVIYALPAPPAALPIVHFVGGNSLYYRNAKGWKLPEQDICEELGRYVVLELELPA